MIKNEREYRITNAQAKKFRRAVTEFSTEKNTSVHPRLRQAQAGRAAQPVGRFGGGVAAVRSRYVPANAASSADAEP